MLVVSFEPMAQESSDPFRQRVVPFFRFETFNSFASTNYVLFCSVKSGVKLGKKLKTGIGYTWLQSRYNSTLFESEQYSQTQQTAQPRFRYVSLYLEYDLYREDRWEFSVPVEFGVGNSFYHNEDVSKMGRGANIISLFGLNSGYMIKPWIGFAVGTGYRIILYSNQKMLDKFRSPYYQVKLKVVIRKFKESSIG